MLQETNVMQDMSTRAIRPSIVDVVEEVSGFLVAGGIITVALFPFAVPIILLCVVIAGALFLVALAGGLIAAVLAAPVLLRRRARREPKAIT